VDTERLLADPAPAAPLGESRSRVLDLLRAADTPVGVQEIAGRTGLHPNTARFHLDALAEAGLAERYSEAGGQIGRPRTVYRARPAAAAAGQRSYRLLAEILTTLVAEQVPQPGQAARAAGRIWGGYLTERPAPFERIDPETAVERLVDVLAEIGFDPEIEAAETGQGRGTGKEAAGTRVRLRHCPFREVAEHHREVVCALHLGLMQGALAELRAPVAADRLDPFVEPSLCIAHLDTPQQTKAGARNRTRGRDRH
jgi:predicted ArsR family transcriptional regulator